MRLALIDNYDSFTHNLSQAFQVLGADVTVIRNDVVTVEELEDMGLGALVISPGPGGPLGAGVSAPAMDAFRGRIPVLGVCLGHQVLAQQFGCVVEAASIPVHGKPWNIEHDGGGLFTGIPSPFRAARYHSLVVRKNSIPDSLHVCAWTDDDSVMGLGIPGEATWGVQFHPESFMTPEGDRLLENFLGGCVC